MYFIKELIKKFWFAIVMVIMGIAFLSFAKSKKEFTVYTDGENTYTIEKETEDHSFETFTYQNSKVNLSMEIPEGWERVTKSGFDTFIHSQSASSIQLQVLDYYPQVNNVTEQSLAETYDQLGYIYKEFGFLTTNTYYVIYQDYNGAGTIDYIEVVLWDRQHVIKAVITINDQNYEKLSDQIWNSIYSINWIYEDPITDGCFLYYSLDGDFEFAIPSGWSNSISNGALYAYDTENTACSMQVELIPESIMASDISQVDYSSMLGSGLQNFALSVFEQTGTSIYGEATFQNGDIQMSALQQVVTNGTYIYRVTSYFPSELGSDYYLSVKSMLSMMRVFYDPKKEDSNTLQESMTESTLPPETETEQETEHPSPVNDSVILPDLGLTVASGTEAVNEVPSTNTNGEAGTLADALMIVAGISRGRAEEIYSFWSSANCGIPADANAIKQNDTTLIVQVVNTTGTNYYLFINRFDGTLESIHVNSEDGPTIS